MNIVLKLLGLILLVPLIGLATVGVLAGVMLLVLGVVYWNTVSDEAAIQDRELTDQLAAQQQVIERLRARIRELEQGD